jgi:Leucine-rich repeat (LRR) protein
VNLGHEVFEEHKWPVGLFPKAVLWRVTSIMSLNISGQKLKSVDRVVNLVNLEVLDISANEIVDLPVDIHKLVNLRRLLAFGNKCVILPKTIGRLSNLDELNFYNNKLEKLPQEINQLTNLTSLNFGANPIVVVPPIHALTNLEAIRLQMCHIQTIEGSWEKLTALQEIIMNTNELTTLPTLPPSITALDVVGNHIQQIDEALHLCQNLKELKLNNNHMTSIPSQVLKPSLNSIGFAGNFSISEIPPEIANCRELQTLSLERNRITKLPRFFLQLDSLVRLNIAKNNLDFDDKDTKEVFEILSEKLTGRDENGRKAYLKS